jgi:hypothetical protein
MAYFWRLFDKPSVPITVLRSRWPIPVFCGCSTSYRPGSANNRTQRFRLKATKELRDFSDVDKLAFAGPKKAAKKSSGGAQEETATAEVRRWR